MKKLTLLFSSVLVVLWACQEDLETTVPPGSSGGSQGNLSGQGGQSSTGGQAGTEAQAGTEPGGRSGASGGVLAGMGGEAGTGEPAGTGGIAGMEGEGGAAGSFGGTAGLGGSTTEFAPKCPQEGNVCSPEASDLACCEWSGDLWDELQGCVIKNYFDGCAQIKPQEPAIPCGMGKDSFGNFERTGPSGQKQLMRTSWSPLDPWYQNLGWTEIYDADQYNQATKIIFEAPICP